MLAIAVLALLLFIMPTAFFYLGLDLSIQDAFLTSCGIGSIAFGIRMTIADKEDK